jgi:hypothetical protein
MRQDYDILLFLIDQLSGRPSSFDEGKLSTILSQYQSILRTVYETNDYYKRNTQLFFSEIDGIQKNIHQSKWASSEIKKNQALADAISGLESDIISLASEIKNFEKFD